MTSPTLLSFRDQTGLGVSSTDQTCKKTPFSILLKKRCHQKTSREINKHGFTRCFNVPLHAGIKEDVFNTGISQGLEPVALRFIVFAPCCLCVEHCLFQDFFYHSFINLIYCFHAIFRSLFKTDAIASCPLAQLCKKLVC